MQEDQGLIITVDAPDALMWSMQLRIFWFESLDYGNHSSSVNGHQAIASRDGKYRLLVSRTDPGVPDWLDTDNQGELAAPNYANYIPSRWLRRFQYCS